MGLPIPLPSTGGRAPQTRAPEPPASLDRLFLSTCSAHMRQTWVEPVPYLPQAVERLKHELLRPVVADQAQGGHRLEEAFQQGLAGQHLLGELLPQPRRALTAQAKPSECCSLFAVFVFSFGHKGVCKTNDQSFR